VVIRAKGTAPKQPRMMVTLNLICSYAGFFGVRWIADLLMASCRSHPFLFAEGKWGEAAPAFVRVFLTSVWRSAGCVSMWIFLVHARKGDFVGEGFLATVN